MEPQPQTSDRERLQEDGGTPRAPVRPAGPPRVVEEEPSADQIAADGASPEADLEDTELYFNRELSWLDFNERVLELAEDESIPLLERLKFCAIYESNLDEFYMVRVANLHDQEEAGLDARGADGLSATEQIDRIGVEVSEQRDRLERCLEQALLPELAEHGIRVASASDLDDAGREEIATAFRKQVFPALTPLVIGMGRPFPYISNLSMSLLVLLSDPDNDERVLARIKVPKELIGRFLAVGDGTTFVPLEEAISANLGDLFPGMEILEHAFFRVTRDTDYDVSDEADDLRQAVEDELRRRRFGEVVRLEVQSGISPGLREKLIEALAIEERQVYESDGMLGMNDLWDVVGVPGYAELRYPSFSGVTHPRLLGPEGEQIDVMAAMRDGDVLLHHPYDAFTTSVEQFVRQAVADPDVIAIKQTVYRTSADSPLIRALIDASERGKQAVCMVELKARFDESANIEWAKRLEQAGVHVVYGIPALKTHAKCVLVARREGDGVCHYAHIGTGNYNPRTARLYTDLGLFTTDPEIGSDMAEMFNYLTGYARPQRYRKALVAPFNLKEGIVAEIERTVEAHRRGEPARIRMKMNSLLDPGAIRALYRASQAGVEILLNVRGICALRPGVPGVSETISVSSVVGRFLEHSRIYSFERGDERTLYTGSADLMPRNLYNRVELVVPVEDERARSELTEILDASLADNTNSWDLDSDGAWHRRMPPSEDEARNVQAEMIARATDRATESATR